MSSPLVFVITFVTEGFIHKIILADQFLPFICISYPLKVFTSDTGILSDSWTVPFSMTHFVSHVCLQ